MLALALARALTSSVLRNPLLWALAAATLGLRWVLDLTFQLGLTVEGVHELGASYELAFLAGGLAVGIALATATRHAVVLAPAGAAAGILAPLAAAIAAAVVVASASVVPAHWTREWQPLPFDAGASRAALALGWVHLTLIGLAVRPRVDASRPPGGRAEVAAALGPLAIGFLAPVALGEGTAHVGRLVDVTGPLRSAFDLSAPGAHPAAPLLPILFWAALATLRALPPVRAASAPAAAPHAAPPAG